ncbi:MAG: response regulator [Bacteroidota bacterium]
MKIKNLKIGTQLKLGFSAMIFLVIILGSVSYYQSDRLHIQTEIIYNHPLQVRRAIGTLNMDILQIRLLMKELPLATNEEEIGKLLKSMDRFEKESHDQIDTIFEKYLGPRTDVDKVLAAFISYNNVRKETVALFREGKKDEAIERIKHDGLLGVHAIKVLDAIKVIDLFARKKGDSLYAESYRVQNLLHWHLALVLVIIMLISLIIYFLLLWNIRKPIEELTVAAKRFHSGDMKARSSYRSINEIGVLSASFNTLAEDIQVNTELGEKVADLASLMLSEYDVKKFFQTTLNALAIHTGSQVAAIYIISEDKKNFQHYESIGTEDNARRSFAADRFEGEFGAVLASRKIQHIKNIPEYTRFIFHTVSGKFIPNEILTIPIIVDNEIVAIISLSSINSYTSQSTQLIDNILVTLSARIEGIMAYHKIKDFSEKLAEQNLELETQKTRLTNQSIELTAQNTELEMQKHQLNESNQLKTSFLSNMSHELRTPLNSVIALSGVLNRRLINKIPNEEYSYLEVIERNGKHLLDLINNILDISRIEAGREEIDITKIDANQLIIEVVRMIEPQAKEKNIKMTHYDADTELFISSDFRKCVHILQNLIANAVKFTEKGSVTISGQIIDDNIKIKVTDTGIGIAENHLSHIFDEFRQADGSTSRKYGGTGLGLAIAQKYSKMLGGNITVISEIEQGSEFTLTLPINYNADNNILEVKPNIKTQSLAKPHVNIKDFDSSQKIVLLVEDSEPAIIQMKDILQEDNYQILVAHDGIDALKIMNQTIPDAIILDLMMPGIDGFELLRTIREVESTAHIPVLILTAKHITQEELSFLKRNNIHQIIQKGDIHGSDLLDEVKAMVSKVILNKEKHKPLAIEGKPLVLIVEDNPDNMITAKALLEPDYDTIEATDGIKSIEMARKHKPNLILMDIALPEMSGIEAFKVIRNDSLLQNIPVIALTASAMISDSETILAYGFDAYLAKPIEEKLFFKTINETLYGK